MFMYEKYFGFYKKLLHNAAHLENEVVGDVGVLVLDVLFIKLSQP